MKYSGGDKLMIKYIHYPKGTEKAILQSIHIF